MLPNRRRLRMETLESRRLLSGTTAAPTTVSVQIPEGVAGRPGEEVIVPVMIDDAAGIRAADIRLNYDTALLDADCGSVKAGTVWSPGGAAVVANVDDDGGTIRVFLFTAEGLPSAEGSLLQVRFTIADEAACAEVAAVDLTRVRLNEGAIQPDPEPGPGADATDGRIVLAGATTAASSDHSGLTDARAPRGAHLARAAGNAATPRARIALALAASHSESPAAVDCVFGHPDSWPLRRY